MASKYIKRIEDRIEVLEDSLSVATKQISSYDEDKKLLVGKVQTLQNEAEIMKTAFVEMIQRELSKKKKLMSEQPSISPKEYSGDINNVNKMSAVKKKKRQKV